LGVSPERGVECRVKIASSLQGVNFLTDTGSPIKVFSILGPTGIGKTGCAVRCAKKIPLEILSCDSRQIYREMRIGTARPDATERQGVAHWGIDLIDPSVPFSAWEFARYGTNIIQKRHCHGIRICVVGGTGLYFKALSEGLSPQPPADEAMRDRLLKIVREKGHLYIFNMLKRVDARSAHHLHPHDVQRVIRALEVFHLTGKPISHFHSKRTPPNRFDFCNVILTDNRDALYTRINRRVDSMMEQGLYKEFSDLLHRGYTRHTPGMNSVGYRELFDVHEGTLSLPAAVEKIKQHTRRYAKRQMTWFSTQVPRAVFEKIDGSTVQRIGERMRSFFSA